MESKTSIKADAGVCSICGLKNEVLNPFIYSVAKINNLKIYGVAPRKYRD